MNISSGHSEWSNIFVVVVVVVFDAICFVQLFVCVRVCAHA